MSQVTKEDIQKTKEDLKLPSPKSSDENMLKDIATEGVSFAKKRFHAEYYRTNCSKPGEEHHLHTTIEDFKRMNPDLKRLIVIGSTGAGKSTLLNVLGGWKLQMMEDDHSMKWNHDPLFEASFDCDSVTKKTAFANLNWLGRIERKFVVVDTPGIDDSDAVDIDDKKSREGLAEMAADLHNKLHAMKHVNAVLILHNDVMGNRLNPLTYTMLKMVAEKFSESGSDLWKSVVIAYSKCNDHDYSWRGNLEAKKKKLQESIKQKIPACEVDIPVIALGGVDLIKNGQTADLPNTSQAFEDLWLFLNKATPLETKDLKVFEGEYAKYQKIIEEKEKVEAKLDARKHVGSVVIKLLVVKFILLMRAILVPNILSWAVLNFDSYLDEVIIIGVVVLCIGLTKTWLALTIVFEDYIKPVVEPHIGPLLENLKSKGGDAGEQMRRVASATGKVESKKAK